MLLLRLIGIKLIDSYEKDNNYIDSSINMYSRFFAKYGKGDGRVYDEWHQL